MGRLAALSHWLGWVLAAMLALQLFFVARIALMARVDPHSTTFQRSELFALATGGGPLRWRQDWVPYARISQQLKAAVVAAEDDGFALHGGVDWEAIQRAWRRNSDAEIQADRRRARAPRIHGGSTITQQLAKNLLLSGERTYWRKGQELVLTLLLEALLSKQRILEIYLNSVEWGSGVFGAEAAAQHYFRKPAAELNALEAARLAVMLPRPRHFEKRPNSAWLAGRAQAIAARMDAARVP